MEQVTRSFAAGINEKTEKQSIHYEVRRTMPACAEHGRQAETGCETKWGLSLDQVGSLTGICIFRNAEEGGKETCPVSMAP